MTNPQQNPDLEAVREQLASSSGAQYWRSLDQLADTAAFRELVEREFPQGASELNDPLSRRTFLKIMGASLALAGVSACTYQPREKIAPFVHQPMGRTPGIPLFYASAVTLNGYASGVLVRQNDGRPTLIEGNPNHPASLGATDIFTQAEILTMYDPDRSRNVLNNGAVSSWENCVSELSTSLTAQQASSGAGIRLLTTTVTSPTLADQIDQFLKKYPQARWVQYEPINRDNVYEGARLAFGEYASTRYEFAEAQVVVSLDADFLSPGPGFIAYARAFAEHRKVRAGTAEMNRLYVVEANPSNTGITADHRLALKAGNVGPFAKALAAALGVAGVAGEADLGETAKRFLEAVVEDLKANGGKSLVIAGDQQPAYVHALAHAINAQLGNVGKTVIYTDPVEARATNQTEEIKTLAAEIKDGKVQLLVIIDANVAYNAPGDLAFADALASVPLKVHLGLWVDETGSLATWHIPAAHSLETWSDARAFDGTVSIIQPLIEPLYQGKTAHELLAALLGQTDADPLEIVKTYWSTRLNGGGDAAWQAALATGVVSGTEAATRTPTLNLAGLPEVEVAQGTEIVFRPDPSIWDGRYSNNGWLQETPRPISKLVWDNAVLMSPRTAIKLLSLPFNADDLKGDSKDVAATRAREIALEALTKVNGKIVRLNYKGGSMELPLWLAPGHAEDSVTVTLGYGRTAGGNVASEAQGINVYPVRTSDAPWFGTNLEVLDTGKTYTLVSTQDHWTIEGRDIYRVGEFEEFKKDPHYIEKEVHVEEFGREEVEWTSLQPGSPYFGANGWGMTFNLSACIGCNACMVACQAENNIPFVGRDQVGRGREMHWIRIDRYYVGGDYDNPSTYVMPMACQQCEKAPCELVCPVAATVHDDEGLNNMVYNRCVGTKYCSNNCPYKVRRFNFYQYSDLTTVEYQLQRNPEVTVRNRGIMEKCSYCVQRISAARINAKKAAVAAGETTYTIEDGTIVTACEAACPTEAIVFGNINDDKSRVAQWKAEPHNYDVLRLLNTKPRSTYLARIKNSNEGLKLEG